jgi:hypothetical protein
LQETALNITALNDRNAAQYCTVMCIMRETWHCYTVRCYAYCIHVLRVHHALQRAQSNT